MSSVNTQNTSVIRRKSQFLSMNAYDRHKKLINDYLLCRKGTTTLLKRDTSRDKRDIDVIRENHRFLWEEEDTPKSWGENLAKKYYDKLFKEYCICDLTRYKENKVALRWRVENEVVDGKGQFTCGNRRCVENDGLKTWEVNFAYCEGGEKRNALVKLRLCPTCSEKLNYHSQKRDVTRRKRKGIDIAGGENSKKKRDENTEEDEAVPAEETVSEGDKEQPASEQDEDADSKVWKASNFNPEEEKSRDKEFEEYLEDLFM